MLLVKGSSVYFLKNHFDITHWKSSRCCERLRVTEDEMVRWHHRLNGHESAQLQEIVKDREA